MPDIQLLAAVADVEQLLGRTLTEPEEQRVIGILLKASALFREEARRRFNTSPDDIIVKVNGGDVVLPDGPVTDVTSVTDPKTGADVPFTRDGRVLHTTLGSTAFVRVVYEYESAVPQLARSTVADVARKVFLIDPRAAAGVTQRSRTAGPFTGAESYATWAIGGQTMLAPDDKAIARRMRPKVPTVWVSR